MKERFVRRLWGRTTSFSLMTFLSFCVIRNGGKSGLSFPQFTTTGLNDPQTHCPAMQTNFQMERGLSASYLDRQFCWRLKRLRK